MIDYVCLQPPTGSFIHRSFKDKAQPLCQDIYRDKSRKCWVCLNKERDPELKSVRFWNRLVSKSERYAENRQERNWFISYFSGAMKSTWISPHLPVTPAIC